jgi:23S rRNA G2069 N7-methylase RlmK/C1962 C5-methylase RlmI
LVPLKCCYSGEGDKLSGLTVDVLGDVIVVQSGALWVENCRAIIERALKEALKMERCVWQRLPNRLALEGCEVGTPEAVRQGQGVAVDICENDVKFRVYPELGQKTGFFCDQREARAFIRTISAEKNVLDLYSYTAGFAINAALGSAASVVAVDSSLPALQWAKENSQMNSVHNIEFVHEDAVKYMQRMRGQRRVFDVVICDPPKLAPSHAHLSRAIKKYTQINQLAMELVKPGGILVTCSCSGAMAQEGGYLRNVIQKAAVSTGKNVKVLYRRSAGPDHPIDIGCPESEYLTVYVLCVD